MAIYQCKNRPIIHILIFMDTYSENGLNIFHIYTRPSKSKVRPMGQIWPSVKFYPACSLVMKYITPVYCYLASSINILHLPTRGQQHFTQHNPQPARIYGQWFSAIMSQKITIRIQSLQLALLHL